MSNLDRISATDDVKGFSAAVKASEAMLRANDPRFRKDPDSMAPGAGGGVTILINTAIEGADDIRFAEVGGAVEAEAAELIERRRHPGPPATLKAVEDAVEGAAAEAGNDVAAEAEGKEIDEASIF